MSPEDSYFLPCKLWTPPLRLGLREWVGLVKDDAQWRQARGTMRSRRGYAVVRKKKLEEKCFRG